MYFPCRHVHDRTHRKRDITKCFNQREITRKRDRETGLSTLKYKIGSVNKLNVNDIASITVINIELICDRSQTPWCDCSTDERGNKL